MRLRVGLPPIWGLFVVLGSFAGSFVGTWVGYRTGCGLPVWPW